MRKLKSPLLLEDRRRIIRDHLGKTLRLGEIGDLQGADLAHEISKVRRG